MGKERAEHGRKDHYYKMAKKTGYRARSAFKLKDINKRFSIIHPGFRVLDVGAAPGGWSQVAVEMVGTDGMVVGVDLKRILWVDGAEFVKGDITDEKVVGGLLELMPEADCVISDISPELSGNYTMDQARSVYLSGMALGLAKRVLRKGGNFVTKVFEGEDVDDLLEDVRDSFNSMKRYHPNASRDTSSEVYVIGKGFRGAAAPRKAPGR